MDGWLKNVEKHCSGEYDLRAGAAGSVVLYHLTLVSPLQRPADSPSLLPLPKKPRKNHQTEAHDAHQVSGRSQQKGNIVESNWTHDIVFLKPCFKSQSQC